MLGRDVTLVHEGETSSGEVSSVTVDDGIPKIKVGDQLYTLDQLFSISPLSPKTTEIQLFNARTNQNYA